jgi:hypothetical protein
VKKTSWFLFLLVLAVSCLDDPDCFRLNNNIVGIVFRVMGSSSLDSVFLASATRNGVTSLNSGKRVTQIAEPLDFFQPSTQFLFNDGNSESSLTVGYEAKTQFVSEDCGPRYVLSNMSILEQNFEDDSVRIVNRTPSTSGGVHIEIFRCPHPDTLGLVFKQLTLNPAQTNQSSRVIGTSLVNIVVDGTTDLYTASRATTVHLPVKLTLGEMSSTYAFNFADAYGFSNPQRELTITYTVSAESRYRPCGTQNFVTKILPTTSTFDSVRLTLNEDDLPRNALTDPIITNLEVFRCPETNIAQLVFRQTLNTTPVSSRGDTVKLVGITTDYNAETYYAGTSVSSVQLPLNLNANSTVFNIDYETLPDTQITMTYTRTTRDYFRNACGDNQVIITALSVAAPAPAKVSGTNNTTIQYPPVTNALIENSN